MLLLAVAHVHTDAMQCIAHGTRAAPQQLHAAAYNSAELFEPV
jgi:hypothetical protein